MVSRELSLVALCFIPILEGRLERRPGLSDLVKILAEVLMVHWGFLWGVRPRH